MTRMAEKVVVERTARVCHEVNRAYCKAIGDHSQLPWSETPRAARRSSMQGVRVAMMNPKATPEDMHVSWMDDKKAHGWIFGERKDLIKKTHPCFLPYDELSDKDRMKDALFLAVVRGILSS